MKNGLALGCPAETCTICPDDVGVTAFALTLAALCLCAAGGFFYWNYLLGKQGEDLLDRAERGDGDEEEKKPMMSA